MKDETTINKDKIIEKLTKLLIETDFNDKKHNVDTYVKKTRIYKDLIKWIKNDCY